MTRKLDKEHVDEITQLRDSFAKNSQTLGNIYLEEYSLKRRFDLLEAERSKYIQQFSDLQKQEQDGDSPLIPALSTGGINGNVQTKTKKRNGSIVKAIKNL